MAETGTHPMGRDDLERWDRDHVWHPFTPMAAYMAEPPLIISRAEGCLLYDLDGKAYIDGSSSLWCNVHGHRVPELDEALRRQIGLVAHSTLLGQANVPSIVLARRLVENGPPGLTRVLYSDDGATAVEAALKMAFQFWRQCPTPTPQKTKYLSLTSAYHGDTLGSVAVGDLARFHHLFAPLLFPVLHAEPGDADGIEALIRRHADELAAVVLEPLVQCAAGMRVAPDGYLRRVREVTRECGVLLILDEVAVGFGRTGTLFACQQEDVTPDFLCLAKGMTGGYLPLAATLTTEEVFSAFLGGPERTFHHGHTYTGNQLGCAVALASLEKLLGPTGLPALPAKIERFSRHLAAMRSLPLVSEVRNRGMLAGVELRRPGSARAVCRLARERGVLIRPLGEVVVLMPPLGIDVGTLDRLCGVAKEAIAEVGCAACS
jgi:adenosylmethionine-8-amino-7-oxononanoate aminotransferase